MISLIISVLIGAAYCFLGFKLNKIIIALSGFVIGYYICTLLPIDNQFVSIFISLIVGVLCGLCAFKFYLVSVFIVCFAIVYILCDVSLESTKPIIGIVLGLICGIIGIKYTRPIMIFTTSIYGGHLISQTILDYVNYNTPVLLILGTLILAFFGYGFQNETTKDLEN